MCSRYPFSREIYDLMVFVATVLPVRSDVVLARKVAKRTSVHSLWVAAARSPSARGSLNSSLLGHAAANRAKALRADASGPCERGA